MKKTGKWVTTADLSLEYGFKDIEGTIIISISSNPSVRLKQHEDLN